MCGFYIEIDLKKSSLARKKLEIPENLNARGPDSQHFFEDERINSFFCRLEIRGGVKANQPIITSNGMIGLGNGQIFNHESLSLKIRNRDYLNENLGRDLHIAVEFLSQDLSENWKYLDGMFAIVIYDPVTNSIYCGRDKVGEKPIFVKRKNNKIVISSIVDSILINDENQNLIDNQQVANWLNCGFVEPGRTFVENIFEVKPGTFWNIRQEDTLEIVYWKWPKRGKAQPQESEITTLLLSSIERQKEKVSKVSLSLSGGVDSGAIFSLTHKANIFHNIISLSFEDKEYDEIRSVQQSVYESKIDHQIIDFESNLGVDLLHQVIRKMDQPISDMACIPFLMICLKAAGTSKVLMTGDGGDEIFRGYAAFKFERKVKMAWGILNYIPRNFRKFLGQYLLNRVDSKYLSLQNQILRLLAGSLAPKRNRWAIALAPNFAFQFYRNDENTSVKLNPEIFELEDCFQNYVLPQIYLQKSDRMSMGVGVEARTPYFSKELLEYGLSLDARVLRRLGKPTSYVLTKDFNRSRNSQKRGLGVPSPKIVGLLPSPNWNSLQNYVEEEVILDVWRNRRRNVSTAQLAWSLYVLNYHLDKWKNFGVKVARHSRAEG